MSSGRSDLEREVFRARSAKKVYKKVGAFSSKRSCEVTNELSGLEMDVSACAGALLANDSSTGICRGSRGLVNDRGKDGAHRRRRRSNAGAAIVTIVRQVA